MFYSSESAREVPAARASAKGGGADVGVLQRKLLLLVSASLFACSGQKDTVLMPDTIAGGGAGMAAGAPASAAGSGGAGASGASGGGGRGPAAGGGVAGMTTTTAGMSAAGSGGAGTGGAGAGAGAGAAGESGAAGNAGESGASGAAGGGGAAGASGGGAADPACDFNGIWIGKQVTVSEALSLPQSSNNWYYLEFKQAGTAVEVSKHFDCGIEVSGSATVSLSRKTVEGLIPHNQQVGRKATLVKEGNNCTFSATRFWSIRGADEARFLPNATRDSDMSVKQVAMANPLPTASNTDGAVDTEGDGKLGVAFQVSGIITGTRNSVQRDWTRWFTEPGFEIPASTDWATDLEIRADFDNEESILDPTSGLLVSGSSPKAGAKHILRLHFLGRDASDPRVAAIVKPNDVDTCFAIQDALPAEALE
ncbi:MAG TPA: hypothetical protein VFG30_36865 [Polyangiales bacterium]|nr:hypothetical protein [Polyangiales bacterium]